MPLFPISLIRLSGLPSDFLQFETEAIFEIEALLNDAEKQKEQAKTKLVKLLEVHHSSTHDYKFKAKLTTHLNHIKRKGSIKRPKSLLQHLKGKSKADLQSAFDYFEQAKLTTQSSLIESRQAFSGLIEKALIVLLDKMSKANSIMEHLCLIAPDLKPRIASLVDSPWPLNKKKRQTLLFLLKTFTRVSRKSSPFGAFGPLAWIGRLSPPSIITQYNQWIHLLIRKYMKEKYFKQLRFISNPGIHRSGDAYIFPQVKSRLETIHNLEQQDILNLLLSKLETQSLSYEMLIDELVDLSGADKSAISSFLDQLIELNFLIIDWPISSNEKEWLHAWNREAGKFDDNLLRLTAALLKIRTNEKRSFEQKQNDAFQLLKAFFPEKFHDDIPDKKSLLFSDVFLEGEAKPGLDSFADFELSINCLQSICNGLFPNAELASIELFYEEQKDDELPILEFHEKYHQNKPYDLSALFQESERKQKEFLEGLMVEQGSNDQLIIEEASLVKIANSYTATKNQGALIQKNGTSHYLTSLFSAGGKMFSRFLSEEDNDLVEKIAYFNNPKDELVAEIIAENYYSVNLHPPLTKYKIQWHERPKEYDLLLSELVVSRVAGQLQLWSLDAQKKVVPLNYGFEALERRSPLFQTLTAFGPQNININPLRQLLRKHYLDKNASNSWPRITLDNGLVILRKGWIFLEEELPQAKTLELDDWMYLRKWQSNKGLPDQIYLKLVKDDANEENGDHSKPQYFDFRNPLFILLWKSILSQSYDSVFIEEVYPIQDQNMYHHDDRIQEWVIEFLPRGE